MTVAPSRTARPTVLAYHELAPERPAYTYALSARDFEKHLQLGVELGNNFPGGRSPFVISFDDGHISNHSYALPLLEKYDHQATFFVIASRIGQHKDFMNWTHLRELVSLGHKIESHGWSHRFLTRCSDDELDRELHRSKTVLEERLGTSVAAISAPHGRWNRRIVRACAKAGYRQLYTSTPWSARRVKEPVEVMGRLVMQQSMDTTYLLHWLAMGRGEGALRRVKHALKQSTKRLLGDRLYYQLWIRFSGWNGPDDTMLKVDQ